MKHLFQVSKRFRGMRGGVLLLDYDGTLTPIAPAPRRAVLSSGMREVLRGVASGNAVAVVSGRRVSEVRGLVGIRGIYYAGNHGLELSGPGVRWVHPEASRARPLISALAKELGRKLRRVPGILVEDKGLTVSVHYRMVPRRRVKRVKRVIREVAAEALRADRVRLTGGKRVVEIRPAVDWGKGEAARWLVERLKKGEAPVLYFGDDLTDEEAFEALRGMAITVRVGRPQKGSKAEFFVRGVGEVEEFLKLVGG